MKSNEKFTQRAELAIEQARCCAGELGHAYVGTEHLLLGIMYEKEGLGARLLSARGLSMEQLRRMVAQRMNLRVTPEFTFVEDDSIAYGAHIASILNNITISDPDPSEEDGE